MRSKGICPSNRHLPAVRTLEEEDVRQQARARIRRVVLEVRAPVSSHSETRWQSCNRNWRFVDAWISDPFDLSVRALLVALVDQGNFHLAEEFFWFNKAKLPSPAQWVTIERIRVKDAVTPIWWLSKGTNPKADNRRVLKPYSKRQKDLFRNGYNQGRRPSGHRIGAGFSIDNGGAIPPNFIEVANTRSNDPYQRYCREKGIDAHPARFPEEVPDFFVRFLTEPGDVVLDPFAGSNTTGFVAERLSRRWIAIDQEKRYLDGSRGRFNGSVHPVDSSELEHGLGESS